MEKIYYIYKITSPSGKVYIGRTDDPDGRKASHKYLSSKGENRPLYHSIRKYGWENMIFEVIDQANTLEDIITMEYKYIIEHDSFRNGYNATLETQRGGDNISLLKDTDKYANLIKKLSDLSAGENNPMYGKQHTESTKQLQKEKAKGRFSKDWFIERYGESEGITKYNDRCLNLKNRKDFKRNDKGRFS